MIRREVRGRCSTVYARRRARVGAGFWSRPSIESLNMALRKVSRNRALFPNDEAVFKPPYLASRNVSRRRTMPIRNRSGAMN